MANAAKAKPKDRPPFITLSSRETLGWSAALFLLFGWLFFLGVLVGRGSIEVELIPTAVERELAVVPDKQAVPLPEKEARATEAVPHDVELSFYTEVKQSEEAITKSSRMTKAEVPVIAPGQPGSQPVARAPEKPRASVQAPPATPVTLPAPVAAPTMAPPTSGYTIQVAAHIKETAADAEARTLRKQGFPAYFMAAKNSKGQTWYRVRVGHFAKRDEAAKELTRLARLKGKAYVVKL
ncbi:SPOR domain-containing protein [Desulfoluna spongiiphila]|uniref:Sporulation related domain-containing protein n=1 Tax=Desulfoluna spongiiphila TaxID=419481 RepID=A0A1G5JKH1_9BACT|nr:SPOR domain-containing protein [Desulfoluna spongiiphila]SCY88892.1 Sporulation related domain-containing protein [Desulfoluna spongiiphila]VVS93057.1 consensus disorder prediction [Desulfoluna spongiiphila]